MVLPNPSIKYILKPRRTISWKATFVNMPWSLSGCIVLQFALIKATQDWGCCRFFLVLSTYKMNLRENLKKSCLDFDSVSFRLLCFVFIAGKPNIIIFYKNWFLSAIIANVVDIPKFTIVFLLKNLFALLCLYGLKTNRILVYKNRFLSAIIVNVVEILKFTIVFY